MKCRACGVEVAENSVFCHKCGERVDPGDHFRSADGDAPSPTPATESHADAPEAHRQPETRPANGPLDRLRPRDASDDVEEQLWQGRYSSKDMIGVWLLDGLATVALVVAGFYFGKPVLWWIILAIIVLMFAYSLIVYVRRRLGVRYRLTSQRFFHERGILRHVTDRIEVIDMDDISTEQSLPQRFVNVGRIRIASSDRTHPELVLEGIDNVHRVAQMMDDARRVERMRRGLHVESV